MSYEFYKTIHMIGIISLFFALGALCFFKMTHSSGGQIVPFKKLVMSTHGVALLALLISGFGMIAKIHVNWPWPIWLWGKITLWLSFGLMARVISKQKKQNAVLYGTILFLAFVAVLLVEFKPF